MWKILDDIKVLDLSRVFAGPAATQILADLGAEVVKIEDPSRGDEARELGMTHAHRARGIQLSPSFVAFNRNKKSIVLDLTTPAGQGIVKRIVGQFDVVLSNFRAGTMEKFGLGYADLRKERPDIIYCRLSGYGDQGAMASQSANDLALQAQSGIISITGEADREPVRAGPAIVDLYTSLSVALAMQSALLHRYKTGEGQEVETSLLRSSAHLLSYLYGDYWATGEMHTPMGTANHLSVPNQVFPTANGRVVIVASGNHMWSACSRALDAERLDRPEWRTAADRMKHKDALVAAMSEVTRGLTTEDIVARLAPLKINVAKVNNIGEAADHPQLGHIGALVHLEVDGKSAKTIGAPFELLGTPKHADQPPPRFAVDTLSVLESLGFSRPELHALSAQGAFGAATQKVFAAAT